MKPLSEVLPGRSRTSLWRDRQRGWLTDVVNIAGRLYITDEGIAEYHRRAKAGEFAKEIKTPTT